MEEFRQFYDEVKSMSKSQLVKEAIPKLVGMLDKAKEIGFAKIIKEFPDITDFIRNIISDFEVDESINIIRQFLPLIFDTIVDYIAENEEIREELEDIDDVSLALALEDGDFAITIIIKDGKFSYELGIEDKTDLILKMNKETMRKFISGDADPMSSYMSGDVKAEGNITKAMGLRSILDIIGDEFGIDLLNL
ncbi:MAG: SCP2 sterol-binding domain-containing protein [Candidatus Helarchaeota archaeon]